MKFKRIFSAILILLMSAAICLSPVLIYSENGTSSSDSSTVRTNKEDNSDEEDNSDTNSDVKSDKKTNDDDDRESGTIRGSKPTSTPAAKSSKSASSKATATPEPKAEPTKNPRVGDGGKPILADQEAAILVNCLNGEVMFEQNSDKQIYPASTTKIMTALLTLEAIDRGEINLNSAFLITPDMLEDLPADGSSMQLKEGEAMTVQYLLEGLMVESGNDAAQALAVIVCGDVPTFVERMNNKAEELGLSGTHYMNVHGLHDEEHYTTAADLCTLSREAMKNKTFRSIVAMSQANIPATDKVGARTLINTNGLLSTLKYPNYFYQYATGIKTGHTSQAGYCLVSSAQKGDLEVIGVVMNCKTEDDRHYDSKNLLAYAIDNYKAVTAITQGDMVGEIKVRFGSGTDHTTLSTNSNIIVTVPEDANSEDLKIETSLPEYMAAPVNEGDKIGTVNVVLNGEVVGSGDLIADFSVKRHPLGFLMQFFSYIWSFWFVKILIVILAAALVIFIIYMIINIRRNIKLAEMRRRSSRSKRPPRR